MSIKMAKEQNLSLNPTKISGVCGRLMCCLKNEEETYEYLNSRLPNVGDRVTTADGLKGEVQSCLLYTSIARDLDEEMTLEQCLYGIMLESANECSYAVAEHVGGGDYQKFIDMMNAKAAERCV